MSTHSDAADRLASVELEGRYTVSALRARRRHALERRARRRRRAVTAGIVAVGLGPVLAGALHHFPL